MSWKKQTMIIVVLVLVSITFGGWLANSPNATNPDVYMSIKKNLTLFSRVYEEITLRYVDEIDPDEFIKAGIEGMTSKLDPYTSFVEKEENENLQVLTKGKYGGVGMTIAKREDYPVVVEPPYEGTPAAKAGIREGDKIVSVDGDRTKQMTNSEVAEHLRGKPGTMVNIKIKREGEEKEIDFKLIRDVIVIHEISYADIIQGDVGFIKLTRFSKLAAEQLEESIRKLKENGAQKLILDLRSNPGGLLDVAVEVANDFVPKGELIVYTKGRNNSSNRKYYASQEPIAGDMPLVVLVNGASASASEIVAGALQDLDRGVIVGSPTYGKGLVQTLVPLPAKNTGLRLTTAKYYIPSGRLIQNAAKLKRDQDILLYEDKELSADTIKNNSHKAYRTKSGRTVYGGGGIKPDIEVNTPKLTSFEIALIRQSMFFNFAVSYASKVKDRFNSVESIKISNDIVEDFRQYIRDKDFDFQIKGEAELNNLEKYSDKNKYGEQFSQEINSLRSILDRKKQEEFDDHLDFIRTSLKREIAAKLFGNNGQIEAGFSDDPVIQTALNVLSNPHEYTMKLGK